MSMKLEPGDYTGMITSTRITEDAQEQQTVEIIVQLDGHDDPTTVEYRMYGKALDISYQGISRLGYKGTMSELGNNTSSLNGKRVTLTAKQGAPRPNGGHWINYSLTPARVEAKKFKELTFGAERVDPSWAG